MKNYIRVEIDHKLLDQLSAAHGAGLVFRDRLKPGYFWRVFQEYRVGTKFGDILRWEKWHVLADRPLAPPEITPIETTGAVLLKQGRSAQMVKYRKRLAAAMSAVEVFQFYTRPAPEIYTDVPTRVLVYVSGTPEPIELNTSFGGVIQIPSEAVRVVEHRHELDGSVTTVVFASGYHDFVDYLAEKLVEKQANGWEPDEINLKTIQDYLDKKGGVK